MCPYVYVCVCIFPNRNDRSVREDFLTGRNRRWDNLFEKKKKREFFPSDKTKKYISVFFLSGFVFLLCGNKRVFDGKFSFFYASHKKKTLHLFSSSIKPRIDG